MEVLDEDETTVRAPCCPATAKGAAARRFAGRRRPEAGPKDCPVDVLVVVLLVMSSLLRPNSLDPVGCTNWVRQQIRGLIHTQVDSVRPGWAGAFDVDAADLVLARASTI
jgi:hypothetical protein